MRDKWRDMLPNYVNGTLPNEQRTELENHLMECAECRALVKEWQMLSESAAKEIASLTLPPLVLPGNSRHTGSSPQKVNWEDNKKMNANNVLRMPIAPQQISVTLVAAVASIVLVVGIMMITATPSDVVPSAGLVEMQEEVTLSSLFEQYIRDVWNASSFEILDELMADEFTHYDASLDEPITDIEGLQAYISLSRLNITDLMFTIDRIVEDDDTVFARLTVSADMDKYKFSVPLTASARFIDGKMAEVWFDVMSVIETQSVQWPVASTLEQWNSPVTIEGSIEFFASPHTHHSLFGKGPGLSPGTHHWVVAWQQAFPDLNCETDYVASDENTVLHFMTCNGTFKEPLVLESVGLNIEPTGKSMEWEQAFASRMEDGKATEFRWYGYNELLWKVQACILGGEMCEG